jgi:hypothetical protein
MAQPALAQTFQSFDTQFKQKVIYARAAGEVTQVSLRDNQVFTWDQLAVSIQPSQKVRPEFGRAYTDFAGAVSEVLVKPGDKVEKGDPLLLCKFVEHVYASCLVPGSLRIEEDQPVRATYRGEVFEGKVLSTQRNGDSVYVNLLIYNQHEANYWHLTDGLKLSIAF